MNKIYFNDRYGHTQAVLDGRKTMMRRPLPDSILNMVEDYQQMCYEKRMVTISERDAILNMVVGECLLNDVPGIGEIVAVAQPYKDVACTPRFEEACIANGCNIDFRDMGWNNRYFVKPRFMPHCVRITGIKIERLQDISDEDCVNEGVWMGYSKELDDNVYRLDVMGKQMYFPTAKLAFATLVDGVYGKGIWERNPMVIVYKFELASWVLSPLLVEYLERGSNDGTSIEEGEGGK